MVHFAFAQIFFAVSGCPLYSCAFKCNLGESLSFYLEGISGLLCFEDACAFLS